MNKTNYLITGVGTIDDVDNLLNALGDMEAPFTRLYAGGEVKVNYWPTDETGNEFKIEARFESTGGIFMRTRWNKFIHRHNLMFRHLSIGVE